MSYWHGKRAVITGGSSGLGRELTGVLVHHGARVAIVGRRRELLDQAAEELRSAGGNVLTISADVTKPAEVDRMSSTVRSAWGGVDLLCNCAGRSMRGMALETSLEDYQDLWETNFLSALLCSKAFVAPLAESHGHIVLVGSLASKSAAAYLGAYPATKFPLAALAQQLRLELGQAGPHVLLVCPGPIARDGDSPEATSDRYAEQAAKLPETARKPAGGAKLRAIDPRQLSEKILDACQQRRAELVIPSRARLLFAIAQLSPRLSDWLVRKMTS